MTKEELRNKIASIVHEVWCDWWKYQRTHSQKTIHHYLLVNGKKVEEWSDQSYMTLEQLPAKAKSDVLSIADKYLKVFEQYQEHNEEQ